MISLFNDELGFKELFSEHCGAQKIALDYYGATSEQHAQALAQACEHLDGELLFCDGMLKRAAKNAAFAYTDVLSRFCEAEIKQGFGGFNIAVFQPSEELLKIARNSGGKTVDFECQFYENGARYLGFDAHAAHRQAAKIVLDAYDCGADFLLVDDAQSMKIFDEQSDLLMRASNREFKDFYVLSSAEFVALLSGKTPASLRTHKLKVRLV